MAKRTALEMLECVARNMPVSNLEFLYKDTKIGRVYVALGLDGEGCYHGVWGFTSGPGMCRTIEFKKNQSKTLVEKELFEDGYAMLSEMHIKGMLEEGYFSAGK